MVLILQSLEVNKKQQDVKLEILYENVQLDKEVVLYTQRDKSGKYGRLLASIKFDNGIDLAKLLIKKGYAKAYFGNKKEPWTQKELDFIIDN